MAFLCVFLVLVILVFMNQSFERFKLPNGMRVIFVPEPQNVATTILVLVEAGSKYETKDLNGLSHFLEHMCFKGTEERPKAIDISGELDGLGAEYNAFTSQEYTGYYVKVAANKSEQALDIISDLYMNPVFDATEIEKEKGVIIEELNMYEDMPHRKVHDLLMEALYGDQPAGWDIGGRKEVIKKITRDDFLKYRGEHYVASATAIVVAGAFDSNLFKKKIEGNFEKLTKGKKVGKVATSEKQSKPIIKTQYKKSDQTHLVIACRAFDTYDDRRFALEVLSDILGGGMSSRLFQRVREELGAAYYVRSEVNLFTDHGYLGIAAGVDHKKFSIVVSAILDELKKLAKESVSEAELKRAKDHLVGRLMLGLETSDALATYFGGQEILKQKIVSPKDIIRHVNQVKSSDILVIAREFFVNSKLALSVIGPYKDSTNIAPIFRFR
ncbi:MAG: hypothetical protein COU07_01895 [Candidatus Harrisonbacteria bacterium CG10_big_fil_rev_8_21_14_0_10_40_38]|uniref:Peptidase M16 n=1 Tax=Candidatus Harrisonbacteria bacterium CG10_big_fil_rev_8_21_14_0_10_40_38 TaxID=1974583 RepID=A0A2H0UT77_9BACT|nr:MAG: hypothetical protein COU07_01895 [Candidatus Harrisonbacteria bacterium CG10_big_fil_rev_8_21_14_0_10_40_38]